jgi:aerobic-type carbon monoxide dehydrogenase small subunit (CoxS/CutS family)
VSALLLTVNGAEKRVDAPPDENLLSVLRNCLQLYRY